MLVAAHAGLLATWDLAARPVATFLWLGLGALGLVLAGRAVRGGRSPGGGAIVAVAALLRLLCLPLPPTLSEDVLRYLWDGRVASAGLNPYELPPDAAELAPLRDERWQRLPHRDVPTVYPPLAMTVFSIAARLGGHPAILKLLLGLADLATCWLLVRIAAQRGVDSGRVVWYAWNPLVTLEVAGMGHVDALGVAAVALTVWLLLGRPRRAAAAGAAAAGAILAKLVPLLAVPAWARLSGRPWRFAIAALGLSALALAPVLAAAGGVPEGLVTYGVSWEFNGPLYEPLWRLLAAAELPAAVEASLDELKRRTGEHDLWNLFYPFNYPQLEAKLALGLALAGFVVAAARRRDPVAASGVVFGGLVLCSATVYPWYLLWVLPWAALLEQPAWRALSLLVLLSYVPQLTGLAYWPWTYAAVWLPFFVALALRPRWSTP